jgi:hypothetical protein
MPQAELKTITFLEIAARRGGARISPRRACLRPRGLPKMPQACLRLSREVLTCRKPNRACAAMLAITGQGPIAPARALLRSGGRRAHKRQQVAHDGFDQERILVLDRVVAQDRSCRTAGPLRAGRNDDHKRERPDDRAALFDQAKEEALRPATQAVEDLNALGLKYRLGACPDNRWECVARDRG